MLQETLKQNIQQIEESISDSLMNNHRDSVTLICVSKSVDVETAKQVVAEGITHLAENRVENLLLKQSALKESGEITWHFIGNLQRRKVKEVINEIDYFHALDSLKLAGEINKRATKCVKCFIQVNVSGEASKQGITPSELEEFVSSLSEYKNIQIVGLMTMAPFDSQEAELRQIFSQLNELKLSVENKKLSYAPCHELSMGMSRDFKIAIEEGATFVRVGTNFFHEEEKEVEER